jgi:hypothetical protein
VVRAFVKAAALGGGERVLRLRELLEEVLVALLQLPHFLLKVFHIPNGWWLQVVQGRRKWEHANAVQARACVVMACVSLRVCTRDHAHTHTQTQTQTHTDTDTDTHTHNNSEAIRLTPSSSCGTL